MCSIWMSNIFPVRQYRCAIIHLAETKGFYFCLNCAQKWRSDKIQCYILLAVKIAVGNIMGINYK